MQLSQTLRHKPLLSIRDLSVEFATERGVVRAVRGLSLDVKEGEILGIVGESGSGKSATLMSILGLVPHPGKIVAGEIGYRMSDGAEVDLLDLPHKRLRAIRGKDISMVFQDPMSSLNPAHKVGDQIMEALKVHGLYTDKTPSLRKDFLVDLLSEVGIPSPGAILNLFPHQLSGGMQQRVVIAIALVTNPRLILMDEPTTALDVTIQAQILRLVDRINRRRHTAVVLVTHDLAVASQFCHRIAVMYAGQVVEEGRALDVVLRPLHPYTRGLLDSMPERHKGKRLRPIPGQVPDLINMGKGCAFHPRCPYAFTSCATKEEELELAEIYGPDGAFSRKVRCSNWAWVERADREESLEERVALGDER